MVFRIALSRLRTVHSEIAVKGHWHKLREVERHYEIQSNIVAIIFLSNDFPHLTYLQVFVSVVELKVEAGDPRDANKG